MSINDIKPVSRRTNIVVQDFVTEVLIYDLTENKAFSLNETSAMIWQLCDGINSISDISRKVSKKYKSAVSDDLVRFALEQLSRQNLLENSEAVSIDCNGLSRREVVRKIGFASLIALPMISSLVAPEPAHAASSGCTTGASGRGLGCACTAITQCQPPSNRCCVNSPPSSLNGTCQPNNIAVGDGGVCGNSCSCISNCCASNICVAFRTLGTNSACATGCQCTSGTCSGGLCT